MAELQEEVVRVVGACSGRDSSSVPLAACGSDRVLVEREFDLASVVINSLHLGTCVVLVEREFDLASEVINFLHLCGFTTAVHSILTGSLCPCFSLVLPTIRRSVEVTKFLVEREFDLALEVINFLHLPAVQIYPPADVSLLAILRPTPTGGVWKWQSSGGFALEVINFLHLLAVRIYASVAALLAEKGPLDWIKYILTPADMDDARNAV
ncbi:unnamed protein product [Closterium sp. NIES-65]|nr:unnamed protein product [Closterium sp. NIES-65]